MYCTDEVHPLDPDTRVNPRLIVEVTSKSTEKKDRGVKLEDSLQVPALEEYLIVSHERRELEVWTRAAEGWTRRLATEGMLSAEERRGHRGREALRRAAWVMRRALARLLVLGAGR